MFFCLGLDLFSLMALTFFRKRSGMVASDSYRLEADAGGAAITSRKLALAVRLPKRFGMAREKYIDLL